MGGQETLRLPWRLEPAHELLSLLRRAVRVLDPVVDPVVGAVVGVRGRLKDRFDIAAQLVRDDNAGLAKTAYAMISRGKRKPFRRGITAGIFMATSQTNSAGSANWHSRKKYSNRNGTRRPQYGSCAA
jgi:hypothetical protein